MKANVEMLIVFLWLLLFVICSSVSRRVFFKHKFFLYKTRHCHHYKHTNLYTQINTSTMRVALRIHNLQHIL